MYTCIDKVHIHAPAKIKLCKLALADCMRQHMVTISCVEEVIELV